MSAQATLFVCKTCAFSRTEQDSEGKRGGQHLLEAIQSLAEDTPLPADFQIQEVDCMSACTRSCAVSFVAPGKYTYLFGDLPALESAAAVLACASLYLASEDGFLPWAQRPQPLKNGILARIPPLR